MSMLYRRQQQVSPFDPDQLSNFTARMEGLSAEELRKSKSLYIRNAISQYEAMKRNADAFKLAQGCFLIIPFFWPILYAQRRVLAGHQKLFEDQLENALEVWKDDLRGEVFELEGRRFEL